MATLSLPSTPNAKSQAPPIVSPSPGNWRHPRLDEILQRQNDSSFGEQNLRKLKWNAAAIAITWFFGSTITANLNRLGTSFAVSPDPQYLLWVIRLCFLINIILALRPLYTSPDDLSDIPLTPSQRALFGLRPTSTPPATPDTQYITPPRYRRSSSSLNATPNSQGTSYSSSPLSGNGGSSTRSGRAGSPFSPSASPLFQRAMGGSSRDTSRRHSYGSPLGRASSVKEGSAFRASGSPSPALGKGASVGLNYKWLYEKSRGMTRSESVL